MCVKTSSGTVETRASMCGNNTRSRKNDMFFDNVKIEKMGILISPKNIMKL